MSDGRVPQMTKPGVETRRTMVALPMSLYRRLKRVSFDNKETMRDFIIRAIEFELVRPQGKPNISDEDFEEIRVFWETRWAQLNLKDFEAYIAWCLNEDLQKVKKEQADAQKVDSPAQDAQADRHLSAG